MMSDIKNGVIARIIRLAAAPYLQLDESFLSVHEFGLDFRVAIVRTITGDAWVRRYPIGKSTRTTSSPIRCCPESFAASPAPYRLFALQTGDAEHRQAAAAQLHPQ